MDLSHLGASKAARAFSRKLYLAWLITQDAHNLASLQAATGMPRRTLQDCIKALPDIGIDCHFEQAEGARNNQGRYTIANWGPINPDWVSANATQLGQLLELPV